MDNENNRIDRISNRYNRTNGGNNRTERNERAVHEMMEQRTKWENSVWNDGTEDEMIEQSIGW